MVISEPMGPAAHAGRVRLQWGRDHLRYGADRRWQRLTGDRAGGLRSCTRLELASERTTLPDVGWYVRYTPPTAAVGRVKSCCSRIPTPAWQQPVTGVSIMAMMLVGSIPTFGAPAAYHIACTRWGKAAAARQWPALRWLLLHPAHTSTRRMASSA